MVIMNRATPPEVNQVLPAEVIQGLMAIVAGARAIEAWLGEFEQGFEFPWGYLSLLNAVHAIHTLKQAK